MSETRIRKLFEDVHYPTAAELSGEVPMQTHEARKIARLEQQLADMTAALERERNGHPGEGPLHDEPLDRQITLLNRQLAAVTTERDRLREEVKEAAVAIDAFIEKNTTLLCEKLQSERERDRLREERDAAVSQCQKMNTAFIEWGDILREKKTLRDEYAMSALNGLMVACYNSPGYDRAGAVWEAYKYADDMRAARKEGV